MSGNTVEKMKGWERKLSHAVVEDGESRFPILNQPGVWNVTVVKRVERPE